MLTLDGSTLEGGGQLVRVALSLSSICSIPIRITNIRAGRGPQSSFHSRTRPRKNNSKPDGKGNGNASSKSVATGGGLKESHLAALHWLAGKCGASVEGAELGSLEVVFRPARRGRRGRLVAGADGLTGYPEVIALRNPGNVWLIWQAIFPYIVFCMLDGHGRRSTSRSRASMNEVGEAVEEEDTPAFRLRLKGGTNVPKAPSTEYMTQVFFPLCKRIGLPRVEVHTVRRGWTTGRSEVGEIEITVFASKTMSGRRRTTPNTATDDDGNNEEEQEAVPYRLPPFDLTPPSGLYKIKSISMTLISGSTETQTLLHERLPTTLRQIPAFSSSRLPITLHPSSTSSSGDERRLYILLTATLSNDATIGRDYLGPGKKIIDDTSRRAVVEEAVQTVVRSLRWEVDRERYVDEFAEDQLVIFQALAEGKNSVDTSDMGKRAKELGQEMGQEIGQETGSLHTRTVRWVCGEILGTRFDGLGGCGGGGLHDKNGDVEGIRKELDAFDITDENDDDE